MPVVEYSNPICAERIRIRDPFILPVKGEYYLYGTTRDPWGKTADGFDAFKSRDLVHWEPVGKVLARPENPRWNAYHFWAPEVYARDGAFYMFYSGKTDHSRRATGVAVSDDPAGPFRDLPETPLTPPEWECLDGHLYTDPQGRNWLFYVHEWVQCKVGRMMLQPISDDLTRLEGKPIELFSADEAPWGRVVVDGPFMVVRDGLHYLMWSSTPESGYVAGYATAEKLEGPYVQSAEPVIRRDGGHNMVFTGPDGETPFTSYHSPNHPGPGRLCIDRVFFDGDGRLCVDETRGAKRVIKLAEDAE